MVAKDLGCGETDDDDYVVAAIVGLIEQSLAAGLGLDDRLSQLGLT